MVFKKWQDVPDFMKNDEVKRYYDILIKKKHSLILKRLFDIVVSFLLILLLLPVFLFITVWIKIDSQGPAFYRQERITQYGKKFNIFKFRTMVINADKIGTLVTTQNDSRITRVGKKIRKCRLDEIPQLFNVFIGDMSFVGTRPEVEKYVNFYTDEMKATLLLPAGVTSLASIKFREEDEIIAKLTKQTKNLNEVYIEKILPNKMKYNLEYLEYFNVAKDLFICVKTII